MFRPGHYTLEELVLKAEDGEFAILILGREGATESRGEVCCLHETM